MGLPVRSVWWCRYVEQREDAIAAENQDLIVPFKSDDLLQAVKARIE